MRKTLLTSILLLAPLIASAAGLQVVIDGRVLIFSDVSDDSWFAGYVRAAAEAGVVNGYKDQRGNLTGFFGPGNNVTVAEALKIAVEGAKYDTQAYLDAGFGQATGDHGGNHWAAPYVAVAEAEGFSLFRNRWPGLDRAATRAEVSKIFTDAFVIRIFPLEEGQSPYRDLRYDDEYASAVEALSANSIVSGDTDAEGNATGYFRPNDPINRAEIVKMIIKLRETYGSRGAEPMPVEDVAGRTDVDPCSLWSGVFGWFSPQPPTTIAYESYVTFCLQGGANPVLDRTEFCRELRAEDLDMPEEEREEFLDVLCGPDRCAALSAFAREHAFSDQALSAAQFSRQLGCDSSPRP